MLGSTANAIPTQLLLNQEMFGMRVTEWDVKLAKNIRFAGKRLMVGIDIYNVFNSDAITGYHPPIRRVPPTPG